MDQYSLSQRFQGALLGATIGATQAIDLEPCLNWLCHQQPPPSLIADPIENAIALLPLWLYTHESWRQRQNYLEQLPNSQFSILNSQFPPLWLYGEAIAQLLRPTSNPTDLLPSLQTRWQQHAQRGAPALTQPWHDCLTQLHQWQQQRLPLHEVQTKLADDQRSVADHRPATDRAIAAALYCFVRSPHDWSIAHSLATPFAAPHIGSLLGGLWGAYNGWTRFPIDAIPSHFTAIPFSQASQQLIQVWSGRIATVATPPRVMGPR
jgi:hypothetical protein